VKKFSILKAVLLAFLSAYNFSLASLGEVLMVPAHGFVNLHHKTSVRGEQGMPKVSDSELGHLFVRVVDHKESADLLLEKGWDRLPIEQNEDIEGLSEDYLLEGYKKIYFYLEDRKDIENAAKALFHGSLVQEYSEGLFSLFLKDLGIDNPKPTLDNIKEALRARFSK